MQHYTFEICYKGKDGKIHTSTGSLSASNEEDAKLFLQIAIKQIMDGQGANAKFVAASLIGS